MHVSTPRTSPTLARGRGPARIEWADGQMPVLRSIRERFADERPLDGMHGRRRACTSPPRRRTSCAR